MNRNTGVISGVRLSHHTASLDELEDSSVTADSDALDDLLDSPAVEEAFVLQTCHRVEAYVTTHDGPTGRRALTRAGFDATNPGAVSMGHEESLRHLLRVAAGLESLVIGEDQILGQVRDAYVTASDAGAIGPVLQEATTKAIRVGERARTETAINEGVTSLGTASVRLAERQTTLEDATALVVGAGQMGALATKAFASADVARVILANRTRERAHRVADAANGPVSIAGLDELGTHVEAADVIVTATGSPDHLIDTNLLETAGETVVVDIAQPRDVEPAVADLPEILMHDLADLESVTSATRERRKDAAREVETLVAEEFERLLIQYKRKRADEVIARMYESADRLKNREVSTALSRLEGTEETVTQEQREVIESLADALVNQLLSAPTKSLRDAAANDDWSTIATALDLFDPQFEESVPFEPETVHGDMPAPSASAESEDD